MPQHRLYATHLDLIRAALDAVTTGEVITSGLRDLRPPRSGPAQWVARNTPISRTATFEHQWALLPETDRESALIRLVAVNRTTWHPSLQITRHARRVMSATATTGTVLFFTPRRTGDGYVFLAVANPDQDDRPAPSDQT